MIIVGIDPSLTSTGLSIVDTQDRLEIMTSTIGSKGTRADDWPTRNSRISSMAVRIIENIPSYADMAVIEAPTLSQVRQGGHLDRHGLWWRIYDDLATLVCIPTLVVTASTRAKYGAGRGNAGKDEVLLAVARRYPQAQIRGNDEADALILAAIGARLLGEPIEDSLPAANLAAMATLAAPMVGGVA